MANPLTSIFSSRGAEADLLLLNAEFDNLRAVNGDRTTRFEKFRAENYSSRDPRYDIDLMQTSDYGHRPQNRVLDQPRRHKLPVPLSRAMTVKHAYRIAGSPFDITVDEREESPLESHRSDLMEKLAWATFHHSQGQMQFASGAWDGSEIGTTVFDLYWNEQKSVPCFRRVDPLGVFEVRGATDPHDFQRVYRSWIAPIVSIAAEYRESTFRGEPVRVSDLAAKDTLKRGDVEMLEIVQVCDKNKVTRWARGADAKSTVGLYEWEHNYGFTPYVIIPNIGPYDDIWGWADYEFTRALTSYIPALLAREADVLRAVANGGHIERGTGANPQTIHKVITEGGVLPSKRDGSVEPIAAPEMPAFATEHASRVMDLMKMVGFAPDAAWGMPGSGSGTDRGLQLQPLMEYTAMKQLNWQAGLAKLFAMGFKMCEKSATGKRKVYGRSTDRAGRQTAFRFIFGTEAEAKLLEQQDFQGMPIDPLQLPQTPVELFDGDHEVRVTWRNRIDPDDPSFVVSEMNKFTQGAQSLETTLENLGVAAPEEEMVRIEKEADRFPWINQGMVALLKAQLSQNQQGAGGGPAPDAGAASMDAAAMMSGGGGGPSGALNMDAGLAAQPGQSGVMYGGA